MSEAKKTTTRELETLDTRLKNKNKEISELEDKNKELRSKWEKAQDECLAWKIHNQREPEGCGKSNSSRNLTGQIMQEKRGVLITDSIGNHIIADKLLQEVSLDKKFKYTIEDAISFIEEIDFYPKVVVTQVGTNNVKDEDTTEDDIVELMEQLSHNVHTKWPSTKLVISLPPPRSDDDERAIKSELANAKIKRSMMGNSNVTIVDNNNLNISFTKYSNSADQSFKHETKLQWQ